MTDKSTEALITAGVAVIVAISSGAIALRNQNKTDQNSLDIQELKGAVDRDLERLKAKLSHGQIISSTQWNAEFSSYQAIWKWMVAIRTETNKIVFREDELLKLGLPPEFLASPQRVEIRKEMISKFVNAASSLLLAIHENAPFYPAPIREEANKAHEAVRELIDIHLAALGSYSADGTNRITNEQFVADTKRLLRIIFEGVDLVENLIRERLASVEVTNTVKV